MLKKSELEIRAIAAENAFLLGQITEKEFEEIKQKSELARKEFEEITKDSNYAG